MGENTSRRMVEEIKFNTESKVSVNEIGILAEQERGGTETRIQ